VFPVRYELNLYIVFRRHSAFKGLKHILSFCVGFHTATNWFSADCAINF
jgi:hypothetical protein